MQTTDTFMKRELIPSFSVSVSVDGLDYSQTFDSFEAAQTFMNESIIKAEQYNSVGGKAVVGNVVDQSEVKTTDIGNTITNEQMEQ